MFLKEGVPILVNSLEERKSCEDQVSKSISDPSIFLKFPYSISKSNQITEISISDLKELSLLVVRLSDGDLFVYKSAYSMIK